MGNSLIDFGPIKQLESDFEITAGRNDWTLYASPGVTSQTAQVRGNNYKEGIVLRGVNVRRLQRISNHLNKSPGFYNFALRSCSSVAARSLALCGAPMYGLHPYLLRTQALFWSAGFRPWSYCYYFLMSTLCFTVFFVCFHLCCRWIKYLVLFISLKICGQEGQPPM